MDPVPSDVLSKAKLQADGCSGGVVIVVYSTVGGVAQRVVLQGGWCCAAGGVAGWVVLHTAGLGKWD